MFKEIQHLIEYGLVRVLDFLIVSCMSRPWALGFGEVVGVFISNFMIRRKCLILENLAQAYPNMEKSQKTKIAKAVWRNLGMTAVEFVRLSDITKNNFHDYFQMEGREFALKAAQEGRGIIFITSHSTNWEYTGVGLQFDRGNVMAVARPMKNPWVEDWIQKKRSPGGMEIILHRQAVKACLKGLKEKKSIGILVDQNLYTGGIFVNFFGRLAATTTLPALLASRTHAPVILVYTLREGQKFRLIFEPPIHFPETGEPSQRLQAHTQIISDHVEALVRKYPENWFWIHNRWKRKPEQ